MNSTALLGFSLVIMFMHIRCTLSNPSLFSCDSVFECGNITASFPFWGEDRGHPCGHPYLKLICDRVSNTTSLTISNVSYDVHQIDNKFNILLRLGRQNSSTSFCSVPFTDMKLPFDLFELSPDYKNLTVFYNCDPRFHYLKNFTCPKEKIGSVYQSEAYSQSCQTISNIIVPMGFLSNKQVWNLTMFESVLRKGFKVKLKIDERPCRKCLSSGGTCGFDKFGRQFCCKDVKLLNKEGSADTVKCSFYSDDDDVIGKVLVVVSKVSILVIFLASLIASVFEYFLEKIEALKHPRIENFEKLIPLKRYSYQEVKEITNSFAQEIGRGGFGIVYRGNIGESLKVAVKVLKETKRNSEDFINEVASMSRTSHVHIVSLLGFCYESSTRAIIYEYVENGSLDKFISSEASFSIDLRKIYEIALGVARGLQYLHYACKTRIVHFDIKPQNILLGKDFCPKISDFGLAKLCGSKESVLWMSETRGTIGYIAPEVFSRMYGNVSHKSDVYSYGMLVLEMIGARKRNSVSNSNSSTMYFPDWIYKGLEKNDCKRLLRDEITEDEDLAKKMVLVGLSCIQASPSDRPSMNRVVEMMEGSLNSLEAPPKSLLHLSASPLPPYSCPEDENTISSEAYDS